MPSRLQHVIKSSSALVQYDAVQACVRRSNVLARGMRPHTTRGYVSAASACCHLLVVMASTAGVRDHLHLLADTVQSACYHGNHYEVISRCIVRADLWDTHSYGRELPHLCPSHQFAPGPRPAPLPCLMSTASRSARRRCRGLLQACV